MNVAAPRLSRRPSRRRALVWAMATAALTPGLWGGAGPVFAKAGEGPGAQAPVLVDRSAFVFPYTTRAAWLAFVRGLEGGEAAAADYATLYSEADYARYVEGRTTHIERIRYRNQGLTIHGLMVAPRTPGPHPVIIYNHGGVMQWGRILLPEVLEFNRLAERGYIVLASTYRGESGSDGQPSMDGGDVSDSLALMTVAAGLPQADADRIGMWGFSRGGLVTYGALARDPGLRAAVIVGGPTDLVHASRRAEFDAFVYPHVITDYAADPTRALTRLSPIEWPQALAAIPLLLLQGGADDRVDPSDAVRMAAALQALHRPCRLKVYEGGSHTLSENYADVRRELDRWFDLYVRDANLSAPASAAMPPP
ncbi:prolyl oligopeptidase family serine peptidase [Brevundimonas sp. NIBR10]|uniref:alpha/beta hydrolase family protein n=1 Tax=Brevundimonas sp. NIBR10 TaxID=3015997 RepID=UPI0022F165A5|nr:prolyl oligopeptidase family serine peptidase [Brevundimonas sp. NIBR10]